MIKIYELTSLTMKGNEIKNFPAGFLSYGAPSNLLFRHFLEYQ